jgi:outer membrane immunogenic protein
MRRLKLIFSAAVAVATVGIGAASAADLPARTYTKAPAMSPMYNWSGFYIGLNGGGGSSRDCWSATNNAGVAVVPAAPEGCHSATGGTAGGQIGYRWQASSWVFGLEAEGNWANFKGSNANSFAAALFGTPVFSDQTNVQAFGLFTGQVGYAVNNVLFYAKGGAAVTNDKYSNVGLIPLLPFVGAGFQPAGTTLAQGTDTRWGGVVGTGIEYGFAPNWSVALEYDHMFMGTHGVTLNLVPSFGGGLSGIHNVSQDIDIGTVRVNYRFGGPVVAKY